MMTGWVAMNWWVNDKDIMEECAVSVIFLRVWLYSECNMHEKQKACAFPGFGSGQKKYFRVIWVWCAFFCAQHFCRLMRKLEFDQTNQARSRDPHITLTTVQALRDVMPWLPSIKLQLCMAYATSATVQQNILLSAYLAAFLWWFVHPCFGLGRGPLTLPVPQWF